jgi:uncharacterized cupredoxin-like copper-binding protein
MPQLEDAAWRCAAALAGAVLIISIAKQARAEGAKQIVQQAVKSELDAGKADHTKWLYYETDLKAGRTVKQWVAMTTKTTLERILEENGRTTKEQEQQSRMASYIRDNTAQEKRRREDDHDNRESIKMLYMLPNGFLWSVTNSEGDNTTLHFKPNPAYHAPDIESRVFAVTEGDMIVNNAEHRIVSIKGRMMRGVKFAGGLFGGLDPGGTFDVERRQVGKDEWQITETHIHIHGHLLFFKNISEQEDDQKSKFKELPENISFQEAAQELMKQPQ